MEQMQGDILEPKAFNLLSEPWIRVMLPDCRVVERSLTDALIHAQDFRCLAGELPTQDVAVLRLLLAVLQTVFSRADENGEAAPLEHHRDARRRWKALWERGRFPEAVVTGYLEQWKERFWLFHPETPFYQVPEAKKGTEYTAAKLNGEMSESSNKVRLFPVRTGDAKKKVSYAEAARWLLYVNGYDDTSSKPKEKGLPSPGAGWLGQLGLIEAEGENLFETLMLNLVLLSDKHTCWAAPQPVWERAVPRSGERTEIAFPDNQAELLTLQSRRLLLKREEDGVVGYELLGGDFFPKVNAYVEQMSLWRHVEGKGRQPSYDQPRRHDPSRQMWRDFALVVKKQENVHLPGVAEWVTLLQSARILDRKKMIRFRRAGVQYGDKDFFVTDVFSDYLDFHADLLTEQATEWVNLIQRQIDQCEQAAGMVGWLADGLSKAAGGDRNSKAAYAKEQYFYRIDVPFRQWLMEIDPQDGSDEEKRLRTEALWRQTAYRIARQLGAELVRQAGDVAFAGRWINERVKGEAKKNYYSSPAVYNRFLRQIGKCFGIEAAEEVLHEGAGKTGETVYGVSAGPMESGEE